MWVCFNCKTESNTADCAECGVSTFEAKVCSFTKECENYLMKDASFCSKCRGKKKENDSGRPPETAHSPKKKSEEVKDTNDGSFTDDPVWQRRQDEKNIQDGIIKDNTKPMSGENNSVGVDKAEILPHVHKTGLTLSHLDISVQFNVLLSPDITFVEGEDNVDLWIFKKDAHYQTFRMTSVMKQEDNGCLVFTVETNLRKNDILKHVVFYKYFVKRKSISKKTHEKRRDIEELVYGKSTHYENRHLVIPNIESVAGKWQQFDGFIYRENKDISLNKVKEWWSGNKDGDAEKAIQIFGHTVAEDFNRSSQLSLTYIRKQFSHLIMCIENIYGKDKSGKNKKRVRNAVWNVCRQYTDDKQANDKRLSFLLLMIMIYSDLDLDVDTVQMASVCESLNIRKSDESLFKTVIVDGLNKDQKDALLDNILNFAKAVKKEKREYRWVFLLPYIHVLSGLCDPHANVKMDLSYETDQWWGVFGGKMKMMVKTSAKNEDPCSEPNAISNISSKIYTLFEFDFLMPRTILASLQLLELKEAIQTTNYPIYTCLASILTRMKTLSHEREDKKGKGRKIVGECVEELLKYMKSVPYKQPIKEKDYATLLAGVFASYLVVESTQGYTKQIVCCCWEIFLLCISSSSSLMNASSDGTHDDCFALMKDTSCKIINWMNTQNFSLEEEIGTWNALFLSEDTSIYTNKALDDALTEAALRNLKRRSENGKYWEMVSLYCKEEYKCQTKNILKEATKCTMSINQRCGDTTRWSEKEKETLLQLFESIFMEKHSSLCGVDTKMKIETILSWQSLPVLIEVLYGGEKMRRSTTEHCCYGQLNGIRLKLLSKIESLHKGNITIDALELLEKNRRLFLDLVEKTNPTKTQETRKALNFRISELNQLKKHMDSLSELKRLCACLKRVDTSPIDEIFEKRKNNCALSDIVNIINETKNSYPETNMPVNLIASEALRELVRFVEYFNDSQRLHLWWSDECKKQVEQNSEHSFKMADVKTRIMDPVKERLDKLAHNIRTGNITISEMEHLFGTQFGKNYDAMQREMYKICPEQKEIEERIEQLQQFRSHEDMKKVIQVILALKNGYQLTGNFDILQRLQNNEFDNLAMNEYDNPWSEIRKLFTRVTSEHVSCIQEFVNCVDLVKWLRVSMKKSALKELIVFVDLAMISAGDKVEDIAKVQSLHAGVIGYSSLIFDLKDTDDYDEVVRKCKVVWECLKENPKIPAKLKHAKNSLHWFKTIQKRHGEVEKTSFMQAKTIIESGVFTIGKHTTGADNKNIITALTDVIKLTIPADNTHKSTEYNFQQLEDLQSKLMLVAGEAREGHESVDRFTAIIEGVIRLSEVYIRLVSSGCVLFENFAIETFCEPNLETPVCAILQFKNRTDVTQLKCRKTADEKLEDIMPKLSEGMEICLKEWIEFVDENRKKHEHLNYFTMNQLVFLQKEIANLIVNATISDNVFPLLAYVKAGCNKDDIDEAYKCVRKEMETNDLKNNEEQNSNTKESDETKNEEKSVFISTLRETGLTGKMIQSALKRFPDYSIPDAIFWYMTQASEEMEDIAEESDEVGTVAQYIESAIDDDSDFDDFDKMLQKFKGVWTKFIESVASNLKDYISLHELGTLLRLLGLKGETKFHRQMPAVYKENQPNLVICPTGQVLRTTMSVYMETEEINFPNADEVLMCTSQTSLEQVDIFLRRAVFFSRGKIHCLVEADNLEFGVCEGLQANLLEYIRNVENKTYRLVIICGSENEHTSSLISSLEKYRTERMTFDTSDVSKVISRNLKDKSGTDLAAASVDYEKSTVRVVRSWRSGVGKTLYKKRREQELQDKMNSKEVLSFSIPLHERQICADYVVGRLLDQTQMPGYNKPRLFHIDVTNEVEEGVDYLLFNLLILGCLTHSNGHVWRKSPYDLYLVETLVKRSTGEKSEILHSKHQVLELLPCVTCRSPIECLSGKYSHPDQLFDEKFKMSDLYQKPYNYLRRLSNEQADCLPTILRFCQIPDPSWSELYHLVSFLHTQLTDFEQNVFLAGEGKKDFPGFDTFALKFLIRMSKEFSSRSLKMSEEFEDINAIEAYTMEHTWESRNHPYILFNADHQTFTFIGFYIEPKTRNLIDAKTKRILEKEIISQRLYHALTRNDVPITDSFDSRSRKYKIERLCAVMGIAFTKDPDETYELTTDNVKKMIAIYMRFRSDIPVIVMGETGCGKTRLVRFLCDLMLSDKKISQDKPTTNMVILKVHGGTKNQDIISNVRKAEQIADDNIKTFGEQMYTVLFFDEANTTESIGLIKEIMCDKTMEGKPLHVCSQLKFVAACNPYRRHPEELIQKLEKAGLGYHVSASETTDRLGKIPLRHLVYRVQPLPQSLIPYVWDFGQLADDVEALYIQQMVNRFVSKGHLPNLPKCEQNVLSVIFSACQRYMRSLKDECSFVSLRDVDRVLKVTSWFFIGSAKQLFSAADEIIRRKYSSGWRQISRLTRALVLAIGVCYHACVSDRPKFRAEIASYFREPFILTRGPEQILDEINCFEEAVLNAVVLENDIAKNQALKENVFMMMICIELRIPLFLVGKPGSSKSLARLAITNAMQGHAAGNEMFRELKQVQMLTFQCSPHSTPDGIATTFHQCASFQENNNLDKFVSVVVLEEIGLAEDSPKLPLKTLHPLLEEGYVSDDNTIKTHKRVGFIGISNWALDPAKMNRGIFVQRPVPSTEELEETAKGICKETMKYDSMEDLIKELSNIYLKIFEEAKQTKREFFGLRDFYSLMKSINCFATKSCEVPTYFQVKSAILRNFSGLETVHSVDILMQSKTFNKVIRVYDKRQANDPDLSFEGLINACLSEGDSRHLLLLTENYSALSTFQQRFIERKTHINPVVIFGSSFKKDQVYTQVCRNINRIKICMETGNTVILLNSENLFESLYEALNQNYVYLAGQRYVDLGLGTHRVKCPVHETFKLIVVAEKTTVYETFAIPLINRLEKHNLTSSTMLTPNQENVSERLRKWVDSFTNEMDRQSKINIGEVIVGFHDDACSSIVLNIWDTIEIRDENKHEKAVLEESKRTLLWCTTPDAILRIASSNIEEKEWIEKTYWEEQTHESLTQYLQFKLKTTRTKPLLVQVTTHENLPTQVHKRHFSKASGISEDQILLLESLTKFGTAQQFSNKIRVFLQTAKKKTPVLLVLTCVTGNLNANLIACARYSAEDECKSAMANRESMIHIVLIVQLPTVTIEYFKGIQCGEWHSVHIDNLSSVTSSMPTIPDMKGKSIAQLVKNAAEIPLKGDEDCEKRRNINLQQIVAMCVQRAMTMVKDKENNGFRTIQRISLVVKLLHNNKEFARGIGHWLAYLLEDKAKTSTSTYIENWISNEAALPSTIRRTGTLRRACLQTLEDKLSPVLAGIISILDINQNMKIMEESEGWRQKLWLDILSQTDIFSMTYKDVVTWSKDKSHVEFVVEGTGFGEHSFESAMPFSWILFKKIEEVLVSDNYMVSGEMGESVTRLENILEEVLITRSVNSVGADFREEAIDDYIHDFVHMVYTSSTNGKNENEYKILSEMHRTELSNVLKEIPGQTLAFALTNIHKIHIKHRRKLQYFCEINKSWPEISSNIMKLDAKHLLKENQISDAVLKALYILIESISGEDTDKPESRSIWLLKVHKMRNIVEQLFVFYEEERIEGTEKHILENARSMWNRVVILQLFIEALFKSSNEEQLTTNFCSPLWKMFTGKNVDMRNIDTFKIIEQYLSICYLRAKNMNEKKRQKCSQCGKPIVESGRRLPCSHEVCGRCVMLILCNTDGQFCPTCQTSLDVNYLKDEQSDYRFISKKDLLADFQDRWFMFFITVIPRLCFLDKGPSDKVCEKLMEYSLGSDVAGTGVAPNYAFRSLIFQLLIRSSSGFFQQKLDNHSAVKVFLTNGDQTHIDVPVNPKIMHDAEEVLLLLASRIEDNIIETSSTQTDFNLVAKELMLTKGSVFKQLEGIARCKTLLANSAESIRCMLIKNDNTNDKWLTFAKDICEICGHDGPRSYILKYVYNQFGIGTLMAVLSSNNPLLEWIRQAELKLQLDNMIDMYVICGNTYVRFKDLLNQQTKVEWTDDDFQEAKDISCVYMQLAMYRLYALSVCKNTSEEMYTRISNVKKIFGLYENTEITNAIVRSELQLFNVDIDPNKSEDDVSVKMLVFQWMCILYNTNKEGSCNLLIRLIDLAKTPRIYQNMYFPTMPHDDVYEMRNEILQQDWGGEQPRLYSCPNGHPYVIADCGRPWVKAKCVCGANIGGRLHKLDDKNTEFKRSDKTQTGHILGEPRQQFVSDTERDLKPIEYACMRFILHLTLYVSCREKQHQDVCQMIKPKIKAEDTVEFLKEHIKHDISSIQLRLSLNYNEVIFFCHSLLQNILLTNASSRSSVRSQNLTWNNKENRRQWENDFNDKYLKSFIENSYTIVAEANELLKSKNELVKILSDNSSIDITPGEHLCKNKAFWMYRTSVNYMHMVKTFKKRVENKEKYPILSLFFEKEHVLKAVRFIPSILKLQRCILHHSCSVSYLSDNRIKTVGQMKQEQIAGEETENLFKDAAEAWEIARSVMKDGKVFHTKIPNVVLYEELCDRPFTDESPVETLLISTVGAGICSYAMLDLLIDTHNEILEEYLKILKMDVPETSLSTISSREMTSAHLICFDTKRDVRPLILANCSNNIRMDEVVYDFENMETLLIDRFIATKSLVDKTDLLMMNQIKSRTNHSSAAALEMLENKMQQECIPPAIRKVICSRLQDIPDICQILSSIDIVIRFLTVSDKESTCSLNSFMKDTLKLGKCVIETEINQLNCKHVKSLWLILLSQRASIMVNNRMRTKDIFDEIDDRYHKDIPNECKTPLRDFLQALSNQKIHVLSDVLFELIIIRVSKDDCEDEDNFDDTNQTLKECIYEYGCLLNKDLGFVSDGFPDNIKQMHCLHTWTTIVSHISLRETH